MNDVKSIKSIRNYKYYRIVKYIIDGSKYGGVDIEMSTAFSLPNLEYIGKTKFAYRLVHKYGIISFQSINKKPVPNFSKPEKALNVLINNLMAEYSFSPTCCLGFSEKEQKWYGWSHRAIFGFGIGSIIKKGDCAYNPTNPQDMLDDMIIFWKNPENEYIYETEILKAETGILDPNNEILGPGCYLETSEKRKNDNSIFIGKYWQPFPSSWGKGEWEAKTIEDAKQMAIDFAKGVS